MNNLSKDFRLVAGKQQLTNLIGLLLKIEESEPADSMGHIADAIEAMKAFVASNTDGSTDDINCAAGMFGAALVNACSPHLAELVEEDSDPNDESPYVDYVMRLEAQ